MGLPCSMTSQSKPQLRHLIGACLYVVLVLVCASQWRLLHSQKPHRLQTVHTAVNTPQLEGSSHWQTFLADAQISLVPAAENMLHFCSLQLQQAYGNRHHRIQAKYYKYQQAISLTMLVHLQASQRHMRLCLVQQGCKNASCAIPAPVHREPQVSATDQLCTSTTFVPYLSEQGLSPASACSAAAQQQLCSAAKTTNLCGIINQTRGQPPRPWPLEVPILAAFQDVYISPMGHVYDGKYILQPASTCFPRSDAMWQGGTAPHVGEVVVATAYYGEEVYHALVENVPRLMAIWDEIQAKPEVLIQTGGNKAMSEYLQFLGVSPDRIRSGALFAQVAYVPNPGGCLTSPGKRYVHALRLRMQQALLTKQPGLKPANGTVLFIRRTRLRIGLGNQRELEAAISQRYPGVKFETFSDNPVPSMEDTARMFYTASVIIGPHGAGMSHLLLASPAAVLVEVHLKKPDLCYLALARELGNDWYGLYGGSPSSHYPMKANVSEVLDVMARVPSIN